MMQYFITGNFQDLTWPWQIFLVALVIWSLVWKGAALWMSARKRDKVWFVVLLLINLFGILEILYIYYFSKMSGKKSPPDFTSNIKE